MLACTFDVSCRRLWYSRGFAEGIDTKGGDVRWLGSEVQGTNEGVAIVVYVSKVVRIGGGVEALGR